MQKSILVLLVLTSFQALAWRTTYDCGDATLMFDNNMLEVEVKGRSIGRKPSEIHYETRDTSSSFNWTGTEFQHGIQKILETLKPEGQGSVNWRTPETEIEKRDSKYSYFHRDHKAYLATDQDHMFIEQKLMEGGSTGEIILIRSWVTFKDSQVNRWTFVGRHDCTLSSARKL